MKDTHRYLMKPTQIIIQRKIGEILSKLNSNDRDILENYMQSLEEYYYNVSNESKPKIETAIIDYNNIKDSSLERASVVNRAAIGKRPLKSKYFSENEIHFQMFTKIKGDAVFSEDGRIFTVETIKDLEKLRHSDYSLLRNKVLTAMNNKRLKEINPS